MDLLRVKKEATSNDTGECTVYQANFGFERIKATAIPSWVITTLLTAFSRVREPEMVILEPLVKLVKRSNKGVLVIDYTTNPKYDCNGPENLRSLEPADLSTALRYCFSCRSARLGGFRLVLPCGIRKVDPSMI